MLEEEKNWFGLDIRKFIVLGISLFLLGVNMTSVNILLPGFQKIFHSSLTNTTLIVSLYIGVGATVQILFGRIADVWNSWRVFLLGLVVFIVGTLLCVFSPSLHILIIARCVQGIGAAMMAATFGAIVIADGKPESTGTLFCTLQLIMMIGSILGPLFTGFLLKWISWQWIFAINIPIGVMTLLIAFSTHIGKENRIDDKKETSTSFIRHVNLPGNLLWASIIGLFLIECYLGQKYGWLNYRSMASFALLIFCIVIFVISDKHANSPLFPKGMLEDRILSSLLVSKIILCALQAVLLYIIPFYLITIRGCSSSRAGLYIGILAIVSMPVVFITGRLVDKLGFRKILLTASVLPVVILIPGIFLNETVSIILFLVWTSLVAISIAFMMVPCSVLILKKATKGNEGIYSAMNMVTFPIGMTIGLSIAAIIAQTGTSQEAVTMDGIINVNILMVVAAMALIPLVIFNIQKGEHV